MVFQHATKVGASAKAVGVAQANQRAPIQLGGFFAQFLLQIGRDRDAPRRRLTDLTHPIAIPGCIERIEVQFDKERCCGLFAARALVLVRVNLGGKGCRPTPDPRAVLRSVLTKRSLRCAHRAVEFQSLRHYLCAEFAAGKLEARVERLLLEKPYYVREQLRQVARVARVDVARDTSSAHSSQSSEFGMPMTADITRRRSSGPLCRVPPRTLHS